MNHLLFKTQEGKSFVITATDANTVAELRVKLEERCGMSLGDRDIYLEGAALVDGQCVSELPLKHNSVLFVGACKTDPTTPVKERPTNRVAPRSAPPLTRPVSSPYISTAGPHYTQPMRVPHYQVQPVTHVTQWHPHAAHATAQTHVATQPPLQGMEQGRAAGAYVHQRPAPLLQRHSMPFLFGQQHSQAPQAQHQLQQHQHQPSPVGPYRYAGRLSPNPDGASPVERRSNPFKELEAQERTVGPPQQHTRRTSVEHTRRPSASSTSSSHGQDTFPQSSPFKQQGPTLDKLPYIQQQQRTVAHLQQLEADLVYIQSRNSALSLAASNELKGHVDRARQLEKKVKAEIADRELKVTAAQSSMQQRKQEIKALEQKLEAEEESTRIAEEKLENEEKMLEKQISAAAHKLKYAQLHRLRHLQELKEQTTALRRTLGVTAAQKDTLTDELDQQQQKTLKQIAELLVRSRLDRTFVDILQTAAQSVQTESLGADKDPQHGEVQAGQAIIADVEVNLSDFLPDQTQPAVSPNIPKEGDRQ